MSRLVFEDNAFAIGCFRCPPDHALWRTENHHAGPPLIVFPRVPVRIHQAGRRGVVADANCVMFYNRDQCYTRGLLSERGDACEFFAVSRDTLTAAVEEFDPSVRDHPDQPFPFSHGPADADSYLRQRRLFEAAACAAEADGMLLAETFMGILRSVLCKAFAVRGATPHRRPRAGTDDAHAESIDAARQLLALRYCEPLRLDDVADAVSLSAFHLCRVFRRRTGFTVHRYLDQLRLRAALERIGDGCHDLTALALALGYSSHAHFTTAFRRTFGRTPSEMRGCRAIRTLHRQMSKNLKA